MNKCIIASDSFKGTLTSAEICRIGKKVINEVFPGCETVTMKELRTMIRRNKEIMDDVEKYPD